MTTQPKAIPELTAAIHAVMSGDPTLAAMVATYNGAPAIFMTPEVPSGFEISDGANKPYIVSGGFARIEDQTLDGKYIAERPIVVVDPAQGSTVEVETTASYVAGLLATAAIVPTSGAVVTARIVRGPVGLEVDFSDRYGQQIDLELWCESA